MTSGRQDGRPLNGSDARRVLTLAFAWIERSGPAANPAELEQGLRQAGYEPPPPPVRRTQWNRTDHEGTAPLTLRLAAILELHAYGWTPAQIGREHGLAEGTVNVYLRDARKRLGVDTLEEAVTEAVRQGLIVLSGPPPEQRP